MVPRTHPRRCPPPFPHHPRNRWRPRLLGRSTLRRRRAQLHPLPNRRSPFRGQQSLRPLPRPSARSLHRHHSRRLPKPLHPTTPSLSPSMVPPPPLRPLLPPSHQHPRPLLRIRQTPPPRRRRGYAGTVFRTILKLCESQSPGGPAIIFFSFELRLNRRRDLRSEMG